MNTKAHMITCPAYIYIRYNKILVAEMLNMSGRILDRPYIH